jgi:hypothetical protein
MVDISESAARMPHSPFLRLKLLKLSGVAEWWARMRRRPSVRAAIFDRMTEADAAPFKNLAPDTWPTVQRLWKAAA